MISRETLFKYAGLKGKFNRSSFDSIMSDLAKLSDRFMTQRGFERSDKLKYLSLFEELFRFNSKRLSLKALKKRDTNMKEYSGSDQDFFWERYVTESVRYNLLLKYQKLKSIRYIKSIETSYNDIYVNLIYHYIFNIAKCYINDRSFNRADGNNELSRILNELKLLETIQILKKYQKNFKYSFLLDIYSHMINMFDKPEKDNTFELCRKAIVKNEKKINKDELNYLYSRLIDYCVIKKNSVYDIKLLELYKIILENKYYVNKVQNFINADLWRNILIIGFKLNKVKWLENIINKYSNKINSIYRESLINYSYCVLNFMKKDYEKALYNLNKIPVDYFQYKNDFYCFNIMINYELGNSNEIYNVQNNFTKYINSTNYSAADKEKYTNFIKLIDKLQKLKKSPKISSIRRLTENILPKPVVQIKWLIEKLEEQMD
jgi:hypothetical protein